MPKPQKLLAMLVFISACGVNERTKNLGPANVAHQATTRVTRLGVHNGGGPSCVGAVGAKVVRMIIKDHAISAGLQSGSGFDQSLDAYIRLGAEIVLTVRWPTDEQDSENKDRVPRGDARKQALDELEAFVIAVADKASVIQINNEPLGGPGSYHPRDQADAMQWLVDASARVRNVIDRDHLALKLASPGITGTQGASEGNPTPATRIRLLLEAVGPYVDVIDHHLHAADLPDLKRRVEWLSQLRNELGLSVPFSAYEWSQADAVDGWFNLQRLNYVRAAYNNPVSADEWAAFIASAPFDEDYIEQGFAFLAQQGFARVCYGAVRQYGNPKFDLKMLTANRTVRAPMTEPCGPPNEPFWSSYRRLADSLR